MNPFNNSHSDLDDSTGETTNERQERRPYSKPTLTEFGNVVDLTRGGGSPNFDGPTKKN